MVADMRPFTLYSCTASLAALTFLSGCTEALVDPPAPPEAGEPFLRGDGIRAPVSHGQIGPEAFSSATLIDFETAPDGLIGDAYADLGVTVVDMSGGAGPIDTGTGEGPSRAACNFDFADLSGFPPAELRFEPPVTRAGFHITTNDEDDTTITAYLDGTPVGSELFDTGGTGAGGSFAGVEFGDPFDRLVLDPAKVVTGAVCIDNLHFVADDDSEAVEDPLAHLMERIEELEAQGFLNHGQANSLTRQLARASALADDGRTRAALEVVDAFAHHVLGLADDGVLDPSTGEELVTLATLLKESISA